MVSQSARKLLLIRGQDALGAVPPDGWSNRFPHALRGKEGSTAAAEKFYEQWATSPFAETYLTKMALTAVDFLGLGRAAPRTYLGISYSSVDYVGHTFGPRSWEIQDILVRLDKDLGRAFHAPGPKGRPGKLCRGAQR